MNLNTGNKSERVLSCLRQEQTCYRKLVVKMREQKAAIAAGNESGLLPIIQESDALIGSIRELDREIERILPEISGSERDSLMAQATPLNDHMQAALREIIALENSCRDILENQKAGISSQMKALRERKPLLKGYGAAAAKDSLFSKNA